MCKKSKYRSFFIEVPDYNTLVVRSADQGLPVLGDRKRSHPLFMSFECLFAVACLHVPYSDGFIPRAGKDHIALRVESRKGDVVIMTVQGFEALVIVVAVPEANGQVRGARDEVSALMIVIDAIDGICVMVVILVCPRSVFSNFPVQNSQIMTLPSSELVAREEKSGWKAKDVMGPWCPFSSNLQGVTGTQRSSALTSVPPFLLDDLSASCKLLTSSSRLFIFF